MTETTEVPTPELDKIKSVSGSSQTIGDFLEWLRNQDVVLAEYHKHEDSCFPEEDTERLEPMCNMDDRLVPVQMSIERWLAKYFDIDLDKAEEERVTVLEQWRKDHL
jgi:hypothetical protein